MKGMLVFASMFVTLLCLCPNTFGQKITACDNVLRVLKAHNLENSVTFIECNKGYVIAKPAVRADGTIDNSLWEYIQADRKTTKQWSHDNIVLSKVFGYGKHSYRQKTRPSMQVVFYKVIGGIAESIKIDLDRFPPSGSLLISSVRHAIQEVIPNFVMRKTTDPERMGESIERRLTDSKNKIPR